MRHPDAAAELGLALVRAGRDGALAEVAPAGVEARGSRAEIHRGGLVEWYVSSKEGLEQGFTIRERPPGSALKPRPGTAGSALKLRPGEPGQGPLVLEMALSGGLLALVEVEGRAVRFLPPGGRLAVLSYSGLAVEDSAGQAIEARLEVSGRERGHATRLRIVVDDGDARYPLTVDPLLASAAWTSADSDDTQSVAWGDWDSDGDLDLATGNSGQPSRLYANGWLSRPGGLPRPRARRSSCSAPGAPTRPLATPRRSTSNGPW